MILPETFALSATSGWFDVWLRAFGGDDCGVWRSESNGGVAIPYCIGTMRLGPVTARVARGAANSHSPRYDVLGALDDPAMLLRMLDDLGLSMAVFDDVEAGSVLLRGFRARSGHPLHQIAVCSFSPYVDCSGTWDDYWKSRGRKTREDWARHERRLRAQQMNVVQVTKWSEAEPLLPTIFEIEASGWKGRAGSAIAQSRSTKQFYTDLVRQWGQEGRLHLFLLRVAGRFIAFQLCGQARGTLTSLKIGHLEEFSKFSPGHVLQMQVLRWVFEQNGMRAFDLCSPATDSKLKWATGCEQLYTVRVFRQGLVGRLTWLRYGLAPQVRRRVGRLTGWQVPSGDCGPKAGAPDARPPSS
jgi:hypothetical protein